MSGEPIDITTHKVTHSHFEDRIQGLDEDIKDNTKKISEVIEWICEDRISQRDTKAEFERRIRRLEKFHESQEELYGVTAQRKMLDEVISKLCLNVDSIEDNPNYRPYTRVATDMRKNNGQ